MNTTHFLATQLKIKRRIKHILSTESWYGVFKPLPSHRFIDFEIKLQFDFTKGKSYQYSKLYYSLSASQEFSEQRVICFQPVYRGDFEAVRLCLPEEVLHSEYLAIRIDGLPYSEGQFFIRNAKLSRAESVNNLSRRAILARDRQKVREGVIASEAKAVGKLNHYPESVSLELTPRCNLQCPHCSSHGTDELHKVHNARPEMSSELFSKIAHELFPHISILSLVGRGEPTMVSNELWHEVMSCVDHYGVKISCVTNGHFLKQRFTPQWIHCVDEICVSIDGHSEEVHFQNRGGSSLSKVMDNIAYFHELRKKANLARRPRLSFYWTLMANNIQELPEFIRASEQFEPDYFAIRHLVVFHDKDRERSLLGKVDETNPYLRDAYQALKERGIRFEAPPLMDEQKKHVPLPDNIIARESAVVDYLPDNSHVTNDPSYLAEPCTWMYRTGIISYDGEVTTCGKHYGELVGKISHDSDFNAVWNGSAMQDLRDSFNTPKMWRQCKECWLRELRWHSQRHVVGYDEVFMNETAQYSREAWDYRAYSDL